MHSTFKNSYLQSIHSDINPRVLNRCVDQARNLKPHDVCDLLPPLNRLASSQPDIPVGNCDVTRRPVGYGVLALPILKKELHAKTLDTVAKTISTIIDLIRDPEKAYQAIDLRIPDRMEDLVPSEAMLLRERICLAYQHFAKYGAGQDAIVNGKKVLSRIMSALVDPKDEVRIKVAECLEIMSETWMTADSLVEFGFISILLDRILEDDHEIAYIHLKTLQNLMYGHGKLIAMDMGGFDIMVTLIDKVRDVPMSRIALKCLMMMTSTPVGKKMAIDCNLLTILNRLIYMSEELFAPAVSVMMFCTVLAKAVTIAAKLKNLPKRLVRFTKNDMNQDLVLCSMKTLTNLASNSEIRVMLFTNHIKMLGKIQTPTSAMVRHKKLLIESVTWQPNDISCR